MQSQFARRHKTDVNALVGGLLTRSLGYSAVVPRSWSIDPNFAPWGELPAEAVMIPIGQAESCPLSGCLGVHLHMVLDRVPKFAHTVTDAVRHTVESR